MLDPRLNILEKRFAGVKRVLVILSGKGGVGKSSCSSAAALLLAERGFQTGLLDLDFQGASDHLFLGVSPAFPEEEGGILPLQTAFGLKFMSISCFTGEHGVPIRGGAVTDALIELFAVTIWGALDVLVIDMPPGIGDEVLDILRFIPDSEMVLVTTSSSVSESVTGRLAYFLDSQHVPVRGVIINMDGPVKGGGKTGGTALSQYPVLARIPFLPGWEREIGDPELIKKGGFAAHMQDVLRELGF